MATIKSFTSLEQSRKLAEILPLESADMWWNYYSVTTDFGTPQIVHLKTPWVGSFNWYNKADNVPCWSLAALLDVLSNENMLVKTTDGEYYCLAKDVMTKHYNNPVDACYEMILKLKQGDKNLTDRVELKFHEGDMIIHKELGGDYIHNPHKIIQVDILDKKYRIEGGLVAHFSEQDDYELVEQKPTIIPKFKVGDIIKHKEQGCTCKITAIDIATAEYEVSECNGTHLPFDFQDAWELVEQKSSWSEEDEEMHRKCICAMRASACGFPEEEKFVEQIDKWLKSLKERYTWKPSDEQMYNLSEAAHYRCAFFSTDVLIGLYDDLKKLREE